MMAPECLCRALRAGLLLAGLGAVAPVLAATVVLDTGHTPGSPGIRSPDGRSEYEFNLDLADEVASRLREKGIRVIRPQVDDTHAGNLARIEYTTSANLFVSLHHDGIPADWPSPYRREEFAGYAVYVSAKNPAAVASYRCGRLIGAGLAAVGERPSLYHAIPMPGDERPVLYTKHGVHRFDDLLLLKASSAPAVQVEAGVIANPEEARRLEQPGTVRRLGLAIAESIAQCLA